MVRRNHELWCAPTFAYTVKSYNGSRLDSFNRKFELCKMDLLFSEKVTFLPREKSHFEHSERSWRILEGVIYIVDQPVRFSSIFTYLKC
jgi:hypothetical protein